MNFIKQTINVCRVLKSDKAELNVDSDIIVPDVMPDILKILQVDGNAAISSREFGADKLTCDGMVDINILYIPENKNEKIESISTKLDFSHVIAGKNITEDMIIDLSVDVSRVDFQLVNSRKLKIKSTVDILYTISEVEKAEIACDADEELLVEMKKIPFSATSFIGYKDLQFLVRESLEIPHGQESVGKILKMDVCVADKELKAINGRTVVKGNCGVCVLYADEDENVRYADFEIPFTEIIDMEDMTEESVCEIELSCGEVTYHTENDSDGATRIIYMEIIMQAKLNAYDKISGEYVADCFAPGNDFKCECESREIDCITGIGRASISVREIIPYSSAAPKFSGIYNLIARPVVESVVADDGRICVEGKIQYYCLYICSGDEIPVYGLKREVSFCENIEADGCCKGDLCRVICELQHKNYSINSAGETEIKLNLSFEVVTSRCVEIPIMSDFEIAEIDNDEKKGIVIYFVDDGDSLWEIAKRYRVCSGAITELNSLENGELAPGMRLLIPSC